MRRNACDSAVTVNPALLMFSKRVNFLASIDSANWLIQPCVDLPALLQEQSKRNDIFGIDMVTGLRQCCNPASSNEQLCRRLNLERWPSDSSNWPKHKLVWVRLRFNKSDLNWAKTSVRLRRKASGSSASVNQRYGGVVRALVCCTADLVKEESKIFWAADSSNWFT